VVKITLAANGDKSFRFRLDRVKRSFFVFAMVSAMLLAASASSGHNFGQVANAASSKTSNSGLVANFNALMKKADSSRFVLTYHVGGYPVLSYGKVVVAQIPSPPGTKVIKNADGYSSTRRTAYVFHGPSGRIVQWIQNGTKVSACVNVLLSGTYVSGAFGKLECSRPSPFIPSNGYAEEGVGFVPTYVESQLNRNTAYAGNRLDEVIAIWYSPMFGPDSRNDDSNHMHKSRRIRCLLVLTGWYGQFFKSDSQRSQARSDGQ
jgi:hypothetical protein